MQLSLFYVEIRYWKAHKTDQWAFPCINTSWCPDSINEVVVFSPFLFVKYETEHTQTNTCTHAYATVSGPGIQSQRSVEDLSVRLVFKLHYLQTTTWE